MFSQEINEKIAPTRRTTRASSATTTTTTHVTNAQLKTLIDQGVVDALAIRDADRSRNGHDSHNLRTGSKRTEGTTRECTYTDFLKCQPMNFKGTEGVVGLTKWFERMETAFNISNYAIENQVKFATFTLYEIALTWWKSHVKTVGQDSAHSMPWSTLIKMMTAKYCPQNEIKKLEIKIWELSGLPDMIHGSVMASKPKTMHDANTGRAYTAGPGEKKPYGGSKPLCSKYNYHHDVLYAPKCHKCNRVGHLAHDCKSPTTTNNQRNLTCYECRNQGQYMSDFPELKNKNHGNQARGTGARRMVHALGGGETNQDLNNMKNDINA
nr:hypothetical protein [Tanacetum cinerariifolium]